jgi:hypothetical protein
LTGRLARIGLFPAIPYRFFSIAPYVVALLVFGVAADRPCQPASDRRSRQTGDGSSASCWACGDDVT